MGGVASIEAIDESPYVNHELILEICKFFGLGNSQSLLENLYPQSKHRSVFKQFI